jgi:hypothetical protein
MISSTSMSRFSLLIKLQNEKFLYRSLLPLHKLPFAGKCIKHLMKYSIYDSSVFLSGEEQTRQRQTAFVETKFFKPSFFMFNAILCFHSHERKFNVFGGIILKGSKINAPCMPANVMQRGARKNTTAISLWL